ncbi:hypothetical protein PS2_009894 [Malus domestica]
MCSRQEFPSGMFPGRRAHSSLRGWRRLRLLSGFYFTVGLYRARLIGQDLSGKTRRARLVGQGSSGKAEREGSSGKTYAAAPLLLELVSSG